MVMYTFCICLLLFIVSCNKTSQNKEREVFDTSLMKKSNELQLSGEYEAFMDLNMAYLKKTEKMKYQAGKGLCYLNIAGVNVSAGNYEKALFFFNNAEKELRNSENNYHKATFYNDYSLYFYHLKLYDKAIECNNNAFYYIKRTVDSELKNKLLPRIYVNKGIFYAFKGWMGTSLKSFLKANELENSAYSNCMVAQYYLFAHQLKEAVIYINKADEKMISQKTSDVESMWVYFTMGYYYNEINNSDEAEKNLKKALEINIKTKRTYSTHIAAVYKSLAGLYKKKNDGGKAYYYLKNYMEEENRLESARFASMNKTTDDFILEMKTESDWQKSYLPLTIALSIFVLTVSGVYVQRIIRILQTKKRKLKKETEELKSNVQNKMLQDVTELAKKNDSSFLMRFRELYPDFINSLLMINPDLENSELTFCAMLKLGFSSKEIADYTFVQHRSIQQKKYRLRKRLNISGEEDLYAFFNNLHK